MEHNQHPAVKYLWPRCIRKINFDSAIGSHFSRVHDEQSIEKVTLPSKLSVVTATKLGE